MKSKHFNSHTKRKMYAGHVCLIRIFTSFTRLVQIIWMWIIHITNDNTLHGIENTSTSCSMCQPDIQITVEWIWSITTWFNVLFFSGDFNGTAILTTKIIFISEILVYYIYIHIIGFIWAQFGKGSLLNIHLLEIGLRLPPGMILANIRSDKLNISMEIQRNWWLCS